MSYDTLTVIANYCDEFERDEEAAVQRPRPPACHKRRARRQSRKVPHTQLGLAGRNRRRSTFTALHGGKLKLAD